MRGSSLNSLYSQFVTAPLYHISDHFHLYVSFKFDLDWTLLSLDRTLSRQFGPLFVRTAKFGEPVRARLMSERLKFANLRVAEPQTRVQTPICRMRHEALG